MAESKKHSRTARVLLSVAIVIIILLSGVMIGKIVIERKITALLEKEPISLDGKSYISEVAKVRINIPRRSVSLHDVRLRTHDTRNTSDGPAAMLDVKVPQITASGIRYRKGGKGEGTTVYIRRFTIDSPNIVYEGVPSPEKAEPKKNKDQRITGIIIKHFAINDCNARISRWKLDLKTCYSASGLSLELSDLTLGKPNLKTFRTTAVSRADGAKDTTSSDTVKLRRSYFSAVKLNADSLSYTFKNGALVLSLDTLAVDSKTGNITAHHIAILPQYPKLQYNQKVGDHSDWIYVDIKGFDLSGAKIPFVDGNDDILYAETLNVTDVEIASYKNRNYMQSPNIKPLLYQSVQRIPVGIDIPTVDVSRINVNYQEVSLGATSPGLITITDMNVKVSGLTNRPATPEQQYTISAAGDLLGRARLNATLTMPADSLRNYFTVNCVIGAFDASILNQITEPMTNIRIASGNIRSAKVNMAGNSYQAQSHVELLYDDMKVAILDKRDHDRERELLTFIANDIVIRRNNPERGKLRIGEGDFERDPQKSFWNYIWKTSFAGVKKVVL